MFRRNALFLATCMLLSPPVFAQDPSAALAAGASASSVIADLRDGLKEVIDETQNAYSRAAFDTRSNALVVLQNLDLMAQGLADKTIAQLDELQRQTLANTRLAIDDWHRGNKDIAAKLESAATTAEEAVVRLPFASDRPLLKHYSPSYSVIGASKEIFVEANGSLLGAGDPSLSFGATKCTVNTKTDRDLRFVCPAGVLGAGNTPSAVSGTLNLTKARTFWQWATFAKAEPFSYRIGVVAVPRELGKFSATAVVATTARETRTVTGPKVGHTNGHCEGPQNGDWPFTPSPGWQIDTSSVKPNVTSCSSASDCPQIHNLTANGFILHGQARNSGSCGPKIPFTNTYAGLDGRGWIEAQPSWVEFRDASKDEEQHVVDGTITWGSDTSIQLPAGAKGFVVKVDRVDGTSSTITNAGAFDRYQVDFDAIAALVVVHPRSLLEALGPG